MSEVVLDMLTCIPLVDEVVLPGEFKTLFVGRSLSLEGLRMAIDAEDDIVVVAQRTMDCENPTFADVYNVGVVCRIVQVLTLSDKTMKVLVEGQERVDIIDWQAKDCYQVKYTPCKKNKALSATEEESLGQVLIKRFTDLIAISDKHHDDLLKAINVLQSPGDIADACMIHLDVTLEQKQAVLEALDVKARAVLVMGYLEEQLHLLEWEEDLRKKVQKSMKEDQESYYKEKRLGAIRKELQEHSPEAEEFDQLEAKIKKLKVGKEVRSQFLNELKKLRLMPAMSAEATVVRNYLDWVVHDIPWGKHKRTCRDLTKASEVLAQGHYGLDEIKDRILEHLAVQININRVKGPILCLVGPPGVGKTSLGKSVAKAMGRVYVRIALGGVRDEAEIRGHRKTYVGAMPGRIIRALKQAKVENPLILLDEIDKLGMDFRGDPASALLEVLDPEQNNTFHDHYIDVPVDLSKAVFITTANYINDIPPALLDRMEVIELSGYTEAEKKAIVERHLLPKALGECGLKKDNIQLSSDALLDVIRYYTREAGVRELERLLHKICRKVVRVQVEQKDGKKMYPVKIGAKELAKYLGPKEYDFEAIHKKAQVGIVRGLAWTQSGGDMLTIEVVATPGKGKTLFTGSLGEVMQESIETASTVVKIKMAEKGVNLNFMEKNDIHLHVPEGATPKDGPSAGVGMSVALASLVSGIPVRHDVAMTGEITLRGEVLPVGGIKEKLLAAHRGRMKTVIIPKENIKDLEKLSKSVLQDLEVIPVSHLDDVLPIALSKPWVAKKKATAKARAKK